MSKAKEKKNKTKTIAVFCSVVFHNDSGEDQKRVIAHFATNSAL